MGTTKELIRSWLMEGKRKGATHVVVVCDTFDHDDYPVYVLATEDAQEVVDQYNGPNMQKVMEVYRLDDPLDEQLDSRMAWRI